MLLRKALATTSINPTIRTVSIIGIDSINERPKSFHDASAYDQSDENRERYVEKPDCEEVLMKLLTTGMNAKSAITADDMCKVRKRRARLSRDRSIRSMTLFSILLYI